ncbi:MAG: response regulator [Pseudomonadota bacterium]
MTGYVLVVDDDLMDRKLIDRALKQSGHDVRISSVRDGVEALEELRAGPRPDLLLIDLNMPRMSGRDLLESVKRDDALSSIPAIIVSTSDDMSDIADCYHLRANAYVTKPDTAAGYRDLGQSLMSFWFGSARLPH